MAVLIGGDTGETWRLRGISHFLFIYFNPSYFQGVRPLTNLAYLK